MKFIRNNVKLIIGIAGALAGAVGTTMINYNDRVKSRLRVFKEDKRQSLNILFVIITLISLLVVLFELDKILKPEEELLEENPEVSEEV